MLRVRLSVAGIVALGIALAGCSSASAPSWTPSWLTTTPPVPPMQPLQFESQPPGADVSAGQGQTCRTPCSLALPLTNQSVTFALNGYVSQTVPVQVLNSTTFAPNPVEAALQATPKPAKPKPKPRPTASSTRTAAKSPAPAAPAPAPAQGSDPAFPPPPPVQSTVESQFPQMTPPPPPAR